MSYQTNQDLPVSVRDRLSEAAQELYRAAFNSAVQWYGEESKAHEVALRAVRSQSASLNSIFGKCLEPLLATSYSL
ncbi:MAG: ChaB family protein [Cyanobacteriota bacterium]